VRYDHLEHRELKVENLLRRRDFYAGLFVIFIGLGAVLTGSTYTIGSFTAMGPGLFPVALGVVLTCIGVAIVITSNGNGGHEELAGKIPDLRGTCCILLGVVSFVVLGVYGGLIPATFFSVFISALGDRSSSVKEAFVLALGVTIVGTVLFSYFLQSSLPMLRWGLQ
jgi:hypothetical protein